MRALLKKYRFILGIVLATGMVIVGVWYLSGVNIAVLNPKGVIAQQERRLIVMAVLLSLIVIVPVFTLLIVFAWHYREGNRKARYSPNLSGNRWAETVWWLVPTILIMILSTITWHSSHTLDPFKPIDSGKPAMTIQVVALDWKWLFIYPQQGIATVNFVEFPMNTPVNFIITSDAPMNSFWIPQLGGQIYAMPGMSTSLYLMATSSGTFNGRSANISGVGFSSMTFVAKATSDSTFTQWVQSVSATPHVLMSADYNNLAQPSEYHAPSYYSRVEPGLYDTIVLKYMLPEAAQAVSANYSMPQMMPMSGMGIQ